MLSDGPLIIGRVLLRLLEIDAGLAFSLLGLGKLLLHLRVRPQGELASTPDAGGGATGEQRGQGARLIKSCRMGSVSLLRDTVEIQCEANFAWLWWGKGRERRTGMLAGGVEVCGSARLLDVGCLPVELLLCVTELRGQKVRVLGGALLQALPLLKRLDSLLLQDLELAHHRIPLLDLRGGTRMWRWGVEMVRW